MNFFNSHKNRRIIILYLYIHTRLINNIMYNNYYSNELHR